MRFQKIKLAIVLMVIFCMILSACAESTQTSIDETSKIESNENKHCVKLTEEQIKTYKSAVSHIIKREGANLYRIQYRNCAVTFSNGVLNTEFNGMGIKISDGKEESSYPPSDMNVVEGKPLSFVGSSVLQSNVTNDDSSGYVGYRYLIEVDGTSNEPVLKAMRPKDEGTDEELFSGKYDNLPDFSNYANVSLTAGTIYELSNEDKSLPISEWRTTPNILIYSYTLSEDIKMEYVPLEDGEYYVIYEITDVNGDKYVTDWVSYGENPNNDSNKDTSNSASTENESTFALKEEPDITAKWEKGEREQLLFEKNGVEVYISVEKSWNGESFYALKVKNNRNHNVQVKTVDLLINDNLYDSKFCYLTVEPGKFVSELNYVGTFDFDDGLPELKDLKQIRFLVSAEEEGAVLFPDLLVSVDMTDAWPLGTTNIGYFNLTTPGFDAVAKEQVVFENEKIRLTLLCAGSLHSDDSSLYMTYKVENLTQQEQVVAISAATLNNVCTKMNSPVTVPGGCYSYLISDISKYRLEPATNPSIETLKILLGVRKNNNWASYTYDYYWFDVKLDTHGTANPVQKGITVWEKNGIRIENFPGESSWKFTVFNETEHDIKVSAIIEPNENTSYERNMGSGVAGKGQCSLLEVSNDTSTDDPDGPKQMEVIFRITDLYDENKVIMESEKVVLKLD